MNLYALKIRKSDLALITLLNNGVTPKVEKIETYFIFDTAAGSDYIPQILSKRTFLQTCDIVKSSPLMLRIKQD